jgi:hypothetical protein
MLGDGDRGGNASFLILDDFERSELKWFDWILCSTAFLWISVTIF